jgi:hypothetical protein
VQFDAFITVGGGAAGDVAVLDVDVVPDDVVLGAVCVVDPVVVVDAEWVCDPPAPQAPRIQIPATRMIDRAAIDTSRRTLRRGLCDGRVTVRSISASGSAVIRPGEASSLPRTT